jgi:hypothetical protein
MGKSVFDNRFKQCLAFVNKHITIEMEVYTISRYNYFKN